MKLISFPKFETERLSLNQLAIDDAEEIYFLRSNMEVIKYVDHPRAESLKDAMDFIEKISRGIDANEWIMWAIRLKGSSKLIGTICLWNFNKGKTAADIGFVLHPDNQGMGFMSESVKEVLRFGFSELNLEEVSGEVVLENEPSIRLMKKYGFQLKEKNDNILILTLKRDEFAKENIEI